MRSENESGVVETLTHYPVKGLSGQSLDSVTLHPGQGFPLDRAYGFARANSGFDPADPKPLPKSKFLVLALDASLAGLSTKFDAADSTLKITAGEDTVSFDVSNVADRQKAADYMSEHLSLSDGQMPSLVSAAPHRFTDVSVVSSQMMNAVSLINADSVAEFSKATGKTVNVKRFRGNIVFSGLPPFQELDLVDREICIGQAKLKVILRTKRCAATEVNPVTSERDLKVPALLHEKYGHFDMGVYAEVVEGGLVKVGDQIVLDF